MRASKSPGCGLAYWNKEIVAMPLATSAQAQDHARRPAARRAGARPARKLGRHDRGDRDRLQRKGLDRAPLMFLTSLGAEIAEVATVILRRT